MFFSHNPSSPLHYPTLLNTFLTAYYVTTNFTLYWTYYIVFMCPKIIASNFSLIVCSENFFLWKDVGKHFDLTKSDFVFSH